MPVLAAASGALVPGMIHARLKIHDPEAIRGRAIATATDTVFALDVLSLLGSRVPASPEVFLHLSRSSTASGSHHIALLRESARQNRI